MARTRKVGSPIGYSGSAAVGLTGFVSVWATTGALETITIPCQNIGTFNAVVDWGDTSPPETITAFNGFSHAYDTAGDHTISISGTFPNIYMINAFSAPKIKKVLNLGTVGWTNLDNAFRDCVNLTDFTSGSTDTSAVTTMRAMFASCFGVTSIDVSTLDTSLVNNMYAVFYANNALTSIVGVEDWDITGLNDTGDLTNFLTGGRMTTAQYDNLLVKWEAQASGIPAMTPSFGASILTAGGTADTAKQSLINTYGWTVQDGVTP